MDVKTVQEYAKIMRESDLTAIEIKEKDCSLRLERNITVAVPVAETVSTREVAPVAAASEAAAHKTAGNYITSPMVGMFYVAPAENADPFVQVGDHVKAGDTVCIIEAMKLMNEITADQDGVIEEVMVSNGTIVEFGQPLFRIRKE